MKRCKEQDCDFPVFGKGYCKRHQWKRTDKPNKAVLSQYNKRSPVVRTNVPPKDKKPLNSLKTQWGFETQKDLFIHIWNNRNHVCQFTGTNLDSVPEFQWHWMFAHILPKGLFPYFKLNPENIVLVYPEFHTCVDNFIPEYRDKYDWNFDLFFDMQEDMKEKYKQFLNRNLL